MNVLSTIVSVLVLSTVSFVAQAVTSAQPTQKMVTVLPASGTTMSMPSEAQSLLAFNLVGLAKGTANIYFDLGGVSELIAPSLSYRSYSHPETRKTIQDGTKVTVDRSLATLGASFKALRFGKAALVLSPYLFFGTEKDLLTSNTVNGIGARIMGQIALGRTITVQAGVDGNNMESTFKGDIYLGVGMTL